MAATKVPSHKVILCGECGVGKTSLFRRFFTNVFVSDTDRYSTLGIDHCEKTYKVDGKEMKLQLWDTGGMERVASITSNYYKLSKAAIMVFSIDNSDSFNLLSQVVLDIVANAETAKIFLCGNKTDLARSRVVTDSDIEAFCVECGDLISGVYQTSCKTGEGVEEMFVDIARHMAQTMGKCPHNDAFHLSGQKQEKKSNCDC